MAQSNVINAPVTGKSTENPKRPAELSILMAYDGSLEAQAAIALVQDLFQPCAAEHGCTLTAMTVLPTQHFSTHESLQRSLDQVEQHLESRGIPVEAILKTGSPAASLIAHAEETGANLIVMGARGLRATFGILLGGVAQQVVEYAPVPVLVVRPPYSGIRRVLVVVDGSENSLKALDYLARPCPDETQPNKPRIHDGQPAHDPITSVRRRCSWLPHAAQITVMHVMQPDLPPDVAARAWTLGPEVLYPAPIPPIDFEALRQQEEHDSHQLLDNAQAVLETAGLKVTTLLERGDAATEILNKARERQIDLIVCGSRGLNPVSGWLLGSVSRKLVHYGPCSVLIVK